MTSTQKFKSNLRAWISKPLFLCLTVYVICLSSLLVGMEIAAWATSFFFLLFVVIDCLNKNRQIEFYAIGVELPLLIFVITVICGLKVNAPGADFIRSLGNIRNLLLLFVFCYSLQVYKNLNRIMGILVFFGTVISIYGIWQHFTGIDLLRPEHHTLEQVPFGRDSVFATIGLFKDFRAYGHSFMMLLCIPWAALLLVKRTPWWQILGFVISFGAILTSLIFTYDRGVWMAILVSLVIMAFFASRKFFVITLGILAIASFVVMKRDPVLKEKAMAVFSEDYGNSEGHNKLRQANLEMFQDHKWIGVGYLQNEVLSDDYFQKLGIKDGTAGHAHSNYIEFLSTTGIIGCASYMLFILAFILMTARLFSTIPITHYWHRVFALAALGAQIAFHVGGLTQWNFGIPEVQHMFIFWLALVAYMSQRYYAHIVPDDHSL